MDAVLSGRVPRTAVKRIVATGTPEEIAATRVSHTGGFLARVLRGGAAA